MAKTSTPAAAPTTPSNGGAAKPQPRLTKMEAVRQAIARLGWEAKPRQIHKHIRRRFGVEMTADHISTYKGDLARKAGRGKARPAPVAASAARETALSSDDWPSRSATTKFPVGTTRSCAVGDN
jgi:hypothetical protein